MSKIKYKKALLCCISVVIVLVVCSPFIVSYYYLPSDIKLIVGQEHQYNFEIPIKAHISAVNPLQLKREEEILQDKERVRLNEPLYFKMEESGKVDLNISLLGGIPLKTVSVQAFESREVIPGGELIGVKVAAEGIYVLGTGEFDTEDEAVNPSEGILEKGDRIVAVNEQETSTKEAFKESIQANGEEALRLEVIRKGEATELEINPIYCIEDDEYKIGAWIKDSVQGIGTLTYIDPTTQMFGALGHGITDSDIKGLVPIRQGVITNSHVTDITKGTKGNPGELSGVIENGEDSILGTVNKNTSLGIYGEVDENLKMVEQKTTIPIAFQDEIEEGEAIILADLTSEGVRAYDIMIQKVAKYSSEPTKGMVIKIVDEELLNLTNGIVQGMSGSPIIQNGKLIGAITHVFVQDPTKGYGIFIENMIEN